MVTYTKEQSEITRSLETIKRIRYILADLVEKNVEAINWRYVAKEAETCKIAFRIIEEKAFELWHFVNKGPERSEKRKNEGENQ